MANTASARKRIRQTAKRTERNVARRTRLRHAIKSVETAIATGDKVAAQAAIKAAQPLMQRAANKGVIHQNTISRKISRMSGRIKSLAA
ncbi:30S ribosomal protein S20 [Acidisoma cladoniae]|jgi:small subunit ribosomal protein S20|uniref:30S ribosomal protein S20 n=1 Tax=Acidisoma cladoniae TaxID=3040935 RepID=UPI0025513158|nr:30S ribosomal protein S20 [Acidisoma sp. PAMC 29798]